MQAMKAARKRGEIDLYLYPWLRADRSLYADSREADLTTPVQKHKEPKEPKGGPKERKNILVQRFDAVGDFLLTFHLKPLVEQATGARPADIYFVFDTSLKAWAEILFPDWNLVPRYGGKIKRSLSYRRDYLLFLRGLHIKTAIFLQHQHDPRFEDLMALAAEPENLVLPGASSSGKYRRNYFFLRTYLDYMPRPETRPLSLLAPFSFDQTFPKAFTLFMPWYCLSRLHGRKLPLRLARLPAAPEPSALASGASGLQPPQEVILHTGGSREDKWWPLTNWVLLGRKLTENGFFPVFSFGPSEEAAGLDRLIPACVANLTQPYAYGMMRSLPPRDLIARVQKAAMVVSIDTSMVHLAVLCGTKVFILSTWEPEDFFPIVPVGEFIPYPRVFGDNLMRVHFDSIRNFRMHNPRRVEAIFQEALAYLRDPRPPTLACASQEEEAIHPSEEQ